MQVALLVKSSTFELADVGFPQLTQDWPQIRVGACGICGSDLAIYHRDPPIPKYWPGHEIAGYFEDQLVTVNPLLSCGHCEFCQSGRENICQNARMISHHLPGGFAEYLNVPQSNIRPIKASEEGAACVEPLASSLHMINMPTTVENQRVFIVGGGTIGLMLLQLAYWKEARAVKLFARHTIQSSLSSNWGSVQGNFVPDIVFVAAAGDGSALEFAIDSVKPGGQVVLIGNIYESRPLNLKWLVEHEIVVLGSQRYSQSDFELAAQLIESGRIEIDPLVTHRFDLTNIPTAYAVALNKAKYQSVKVLVIPNA